MVLAMLPAKMELKVNADSTVPVRDQLLEQIGLQIASGVLKASDRMPSIRALAQKLGIHHGIVNSAYKRLSEMGMLDIRHGSGVRVAQNIGLATADGQMDLDSLFLQFIGKARQLGYTRAQIRNCYEQFHKRGPIKRIVVVDRNPDFHPVILSELEPNFSLPVLTVTPEHLKENSSLLTDSLVITSLYHFLAVQKLPIDPTRFMICNVEPAKEAVDLLNSLPANSMVLLISVSPTLLRIGCNIAAALRGDSITAKPLLTKETVEIAYSMQFCKAAICDIPSHKKVAPIAKKVPLSTFNLYSTATIQSIKDNLKDWG
jgi:GntR family transcriptional regulator